MSTEAAPQVPDFAVESSGLSVVTATRASDNPRQGAIYHPDTLAAGIPVWFHPLQDGRYLCLFSERWYAATVGDTGPQAYSTHQVSTTPSWVIVDPATGVSEGVVDIPSRLDGTRLLYAATSRVDSLYTLGVLGSVPLIQHHRVTDSGQLILMGEELVPVVGTANVFLNAGAYIDGIYLCVFGVDIDDKVYLARKHWGRIGQTDPELPWEYKGTKGWYKDPDMITPLVDTKGAPLTSPHGIVTFAQYRDKQWITTADATTAYIWSSRLVEQSWKKSRLILNASETRLQPQLHADVTKLIESAAAIPWVQTKFVSAGGSQAQVVAWGLLSV